MEIIEKVVFPEENGDGPDVYYQPLAIFELGNFRALRELLTKEEVNKYCGEKVMSGGDVEIALHGLMEKCDYRVELAQEYLCRVLLKCINTKSEIKELIVKLTWC